MQNRVEKDRPPSPRRAESRRLVQGGREETGGIPLERRAEASSRPLRKPPLPGSLEWPGALSPGKKSGTAEVCAFVSLEAGALLFLGGGAAGFRHVLRQSLFASGG